MQTVKKQVLFLVFFLVLSTLTRDGQCQEILQEVQTNTPSFSSLSFIDFNSYSGADSYKFLWAVDRQTMQLVQIDLNTGKPNLFVPLNVTFPEDICWENRLKVWVSDSSGKSLLQVSVPGGKIIKKIPSPGDGPSGLAIGGGYLWNVDFKEETLFKMDLADGHVVNQYTIPSYVEGMTAAGDYIFMIANNELHKFDIKAGSITSSYTLPYPDMMGVTWNGQYFYMNQKDSSSVHVFRLQ